MAAVHYLEFLNFRILSKIQVSAYFYVDLQNFVTTGRSATELLRIVDFQNGGRSQSWIWYETVADHPLFVFDGPNVLLTLHVDRVHTLQNIAIFIFGTFGLKLLIHAPFGEFFFEFRYCCNPEADRPWAKTRHEP